MFALLLGVAMTLPIGGADMPVVISLYNALTGLAVGFEGFVLDNAAMIIAGTVVGAAGTLLTPAHGQGDETVPWAMSCSRISARVRPPGAAASPGLRRPSKPPTPA